MVRQKVSLKVVCYFLRNRWNSKAKFHWLITCSHLHKMAKWHLIFAYCCKVIEFLRDNIVILNTQKLRTVLSNAHWKIRVPSCCLCRQSAENYINNVKSFLLIYYCFITARCKAECGYDNVKCQKWIYIAHSRSKPLMRSMRCMWYAVRLSVCLWRSGTVIA